MFLSAKQRVLALGDAGSIVTSELVLVTSMCVLGLIAGGASVRDAVVVELSDAAGSVQDLNQSFSVQGIVGHGTQTAGFDFRDGVDFCDDAEDAAGGADNCVTFDGPAIDEFPGYVASSPGTYSVDRVTSGTGGSVTGTIGDGTIDTGFTVDTDTGTISSSTNGSEIWFGESPYNSGTFTITYDEPLTEYEFWVRSLAGIYGAPENILGNFTVTLSDGTVIENAPFTIVPDVIAGSQTYGFFRTSSGDRSPLEKVTRGGADYVKDSSDNGSGHQGAGRIVFPDIPTVGNPAGAGAVGIQSLSFERSGGPNGYRAAFSSSGRVIRENTP